MKKQQQTIASLPRRFGAYLLDWYIGALYIISYRNCVTEDLWHNEEPESIRIPSSIRTDLWVTRITRRNYLLCHYSFSD